VKRDALTAGITVERFWRMTYAEVVEEIEAVNRRREIDYQDQRRLRAEMDYQLAQLIGTAFGSPKKYPKTLQKAYPGIFKPRPTWQEHKAGFARFARAHNRKMGGDRD